MRQVEMEVKDHLSMNTLAERLISARGEKGWRKADLQRAAGLKSPSTLTELENGSATESPQLGKIASALGVEVLWLQYGKGPRHAPRGLLYAPQKIDPAPSGPGLLSHADPTIEAIISIARQLSVQGRMDLYADARQLLAQESRLNGSAPKRSRHLTLVSRSL